MGVAYIHMHIHIHKYTDNGNCAHTSPPSSSSSSSLNEIVQGIKLNDSMNA